MLCQGRADLDPAPGPAGIANGFAQGRLTYAQDVRQRENALGRWALGLGPPERAERLLHQGSRAAGGSSRRSSSGGHEGRRSTPALWAVAPSSGPVTLPWNGLTSKTGR